MMWVGLLRSTLSAIAANIGLYICNKSRHDIIPYCIEYNCTFQQT